MKASIRFINDNGVVEHELVDFPLVFRYKDYRANLRYVVGTNIEVGSILSILLIDTEKW
jgi:hypothetical protein